MFFFNTNLYCFLDYGLFIVWYLLRLFGPFKLAWELLMITWSSGTTFFNSASSMLPTDLWTKVSDVLSLLADVWWRCYLFRDLPVFWFIIRIVWLFSLLSGELSFGFGGPRLLRGLWKLKLFRVEKLLYDMLIIGNLHKFAFAFKCLSKSSSCLLQFRFFETLRSINLRASWAFSIFIYLASYLLRNSWRKGGGGFRLSSSFP